MPASTQRERTVFDWLLDIDKTPIVGGTIRVVSSVAVNYGTGGVVVNRQMLVVTDASGYWSVSVIPTGDFLNETKIDFTFPTENDGPPVDATKTSITLDYGDGTAIQFKTAVALGSDDVIVVTDTLRDAIADEVAAQGGGGGLTLEQIQDAVAAMLVSGANTTITYNDGAATITVAEAAAALTTEQIQDMIATFITNGSNVTITYNDAGNALSIAATGGSATNLDALTDVVISSPSIGQVIKYNGTNWINDADAVGGGGGSAVETLISNATDLAAAITTANNNPNTGYSWKLTGVVNIAANTVISANVLIDVANGGRFVQTANGSTLTFNGTLIAPAVRVFQDFESADVILAGTVEKIYPQWFGAKGDGQKAYGGMTSGQSTVSGVTFTSSDVGKTVIVPDAGASGADLLTTISSVTSGTATLASAAATTVATKLIVWGTDNTLPIQSAVNVAAYQNRGGTVKFPRVAEFYAIFGTNAEGVIDFNRTKNIRFEGEASNTTVGVDTKGALFFTAGAGVKRLFEARSTYSASFERLKIIYSNGDFTGNIIDCGRYYQNNQVIVYGGDTQLARVENCELTGYSDATFTALNAHSGVNLNEAITSWVYGNQFFWMQSGILGRDPAVISRAYSNAVWIEKNQFLRVLHGVRNHNEGWTVFNNTFEPGLNGVAFTGVSDDPALNPGYSINILTNWFGDSSLPDGSRWINVKSLNATIAGNFIGAFSSIITAPIKFDVSGGTLLENVTLRENTFAAFVYAVEISGNGSVGKFSYDNEKMLPGGNFTYRTLTGGATIQAEYQGKFRNQADLFSNRMPDLLTGNVLFKEFSDISQLTGKSNASIGTVSGFGSAFGALSLFGRTVAGSSSAIDLWTGTGAGEVTFLAANVNAAANTITLSADSLQTGDEFFLTQSSLPAPLLQDTLYFAIRTAANTIKVATSLANANAGTAIDLTDISFTSSTVDTTENFIGITGVSIVSGDTIQFSTTGTLPAPLSAGTTYYAYISTNRLYVATSLNNVLSPNFIDLTSVGAGSSKVFKTATGYLNRPPRRRMSILNGDMALEPNTLTVVPLAGTGTRMVVANSAGLLSTQTIPSGGGGTVDTVLADGSLNAISNNAVFDGLALKAPLASPALTGVPTAPTATVGTNTTQLATTAFVLANAAGSGGALRYATTFGDGAATSYTITHGLATRDVIVRVYEAASPYAVIDCTVANTTTTTVTLTFSDGEIPTTNQYRCVVIA